MNTLKNMSDIELTDELRSLAKNLKTLQGKKHGAPTIPQDYVYNAHIESEVQSIKSLQQQVGIELLERDKKREEKNRKKLEIRKLEGVDVANELLEQLPAFAEQVNVAFIALGNQYTELLAMSDMLRKTNLMLLNNNMSSCVPAAIKLQSNNLNKLLKEQFRTCFGENASNAFLPQKTHDFDIVEAVEAIKLECSEANQKGVKT